MADTRTELLFAQDPTTGATAPMVFGGETPDVPTYLVFATSAPVSTALVFGDGTGGGGGTAPVTVTASIDLALPSTLLVQALGGLTVRATVQFTLSSTLVVQALGMPTALATVQLTLPSTLSVHASGYYDNRVTPWKEAFAKTAAQPATAMAEGAGLAWGLSAQQVPQVRALHSPAQPCGVGTQAAQSAAQPNVVAATAMHTPANGVTAQGSMPAQTGVSHQRDAQAPHALATPSQSFLTGGLQTGIPRLCERNPAHQVAARHYRGWGGSMGQGAHSLRGAVLPWGTGRTPPPGKQVWPPVVPVTPPAAVSTELLFACPPLAFPHLVFGATCEQVPPAQSPFYILPARFYMAVHNVAAYLLPGLEPVPIFDLSLAADVDSTVWTFSASVPREYFDALAPTSGTPRQIKVVADAMEWVFLVDSLKQTESFGKRRAAIGGRSATALGGVPYSRATQRLSTTAQTAQQIATAALQYTGVGLDWGITDWLVASGAWSHTGTPLAAVQAIAQAAGGYVLSHRSQPTLLVRHPYPLLPGGIPGGPWNWEGAAGVFAADVALAPDVILSRSVERADGADIDGVYVAGTVAGSVEALVRRSGTMGAKLAAMQTDALITAVEAAQQRGLAMLGAGGAKHKVQITMPVLVGGANPGLLDVGQLVQINDTAPWRGRVRAVQMQYTAPTLRQTVTLERHLA